MKKHIQFWAIIASLLSALAVNAQQLTQTVRGKVVDQAGEYPLIGAVVYIENTNPTLGASTDGNGEFVIINVPVGRITLKAKYMGYEDISIPNLVIGSAKEVIVTIELNEKLQQIEEVVVKAIQNKGVAQNEMALLSSRTISADETNRFAGSLQDPSRMVSAYAGVTSDPMGSNDVVVRGNSPKGILWRLEGVDIANPNHFADEGSTGGPINALNGELLASSDFYTGAFPAEFGNALSGVFDMRFRTGNNNKREYCVGVGVLGTDITVEGPFSKNYKGSYLANYRYSSLELLDRAKIVDFGGVPLYQDGAFKVVLPSKKAGTLSLFGMGGKSEIHDDITASEESEEIVEKARFGSNMGVAGLNYMLPVTQGSFLKLTIAGTTNGSDFYDEKLDESNQFKMNADGNWQKSSLQNALTYNAKLSARTKFIGGAKLSTMSYDMFEQYESETNKIDTALMMTDHAWTTSGFVSLKHRLTEKITLTGGLQTAYFSMNDKAVLEPRLSAKWQINNKQAINMGYGKHSKAESMVTYYSRETLADGSSIEPNRNLGFSQANHYILGYEHKLSENLLAKVDLYYQALYNIPVENADSSVFSMINSDEGYIDKALVNEGEGTNYGAEISLEKFFAHQYYFLFSSSFYNSKYTTKDGIERNTKYNGNYAVNFLVGKEFTINKKNVLSVNAKFFVNGGRRYVPIDLEASQKAGYSVYNESKAWDDILDPVQQMNFSISYRINRKKAAHEFLLDVVNVTSAQARIWEYYNEDNQKIDYYYQLNMIPNLMYRIHF